MTFEVVLTFIEGTFFVTLIVTVLVALLYLEVAAAVRVIFAVPAFFVSKTVIFESVIIIL